MWKPTLIQSFRLKRGVAIIALPLCCLLQVNGALARRLDKRVKTGNSDKLEREVVDACGCSMVAPTKIEILHDYHAWTELRQSTPQVVNLVNHLKRVILDVSRFIHVRVAIASLHTWIYRYDVQSGCFGHSPVLSSARCIAVSSSATNSLYLITSLQRLAI